ncbi:MAG TPA: serine hydrolase domain-containing protein [Rhizomicrobium sp.]|nr:serine hydrolase domain-containing protein [Rhizomicrobium sp.]
MGPPVADYRKISRRHAASGFLTAITAGRICYALGNPSHLRTDNALPPNVQAFLNSFAPRQLPGVAIAIRGSANTLVGEAGYRSLAARTLIRATDAIGIGSITKTFVAVVAMQLEEAGRISLDALALDYLGSQKLRNVANIGNASIAQLMGHTSGIPSWEDDPDWIRDARGASINPTKIWSSTASLQYIYGKPALFAPGAKYSYSNSNYTILGLIIEAITGNALWHEIARRICAPLDLYNTYMDGISTPAKATLCANRYQYVTPYFERIAGVSKYFTKVGDDLFDVSKANLSCEWAAGSIVSTAPDVAKFFSALRSGRLLKPASLGFMTAWREAGVTSQGPFYVGHGLFRQSSAGRSLVGHTGGVLGSTANAFWIEGRPIAYAALSNFGTEDTGQSSRMTANSVAQSPKFVEMISGLVERI